jgi:hypothetical protein
MSTQAEAKLAVLENRLDRIERALEGIASSLAILARVEIQNAALTATVQEQGLAIAAIKEEMPSLKLVRFGAGSLVIGILAAVGTAVLKLIGLGAS